jgi:ribonuclease D
MHAVVRYLNPSIVRWPSLKHLVEEHLHSTLRKDQQKSNWAWRPLSPKQQHYAACDALVLLRLFDAMRCKMKQSLSRGGGVSHTLQEAVKAVCSDVDLSQPGALDKKKRIGKKRTKEDNAVTGM